MVLPWTAETLISRQSERNRWKQLWLNASRSCPPRFPLRVRRLLRLHLCVSLVFFEPSCVIEQKPPFCPNPACPAMGDYGDAYMRKDVSGPPGRTKAQNRATVQQLKLVTTSIAILPSLVLLVSLGLHFIRDNAVCALWWSCFVLFWFGWAAKNFVCSGVCTLANPRPRVWTSEGLVLALDLVSWHGGGVLRLA